MAGPTPRAGGSRDHRKDDIRSANYHCAFLFASLSHPQHWALGHASVHPSEDAWGQWHEVVAFGGRDGVPRGRAMCAKVPMGPVRAMETRSRHFRACPTGRARVYVAPVCPGGRVCMHHSVLRAGGSIETHSTQVVEPYSHVWTHIWDF